MYPTDSCIMPPTHTRLPQSRRKSNHALLRRAERHGLGVQYKKGPGTGAAAAATAASASASGVSGSGSAGGGCGRKRKKEKK